MRPNVFWSEQINDWICDESSYELLSGIAGDDLEVIAHGVLDRQRLFVVQVVAVVADAVDHAASVIHDHGSYQEMGFPRSTPTWTSRWRAACSACPRCTWIASASI